MERRYREGKENRIYRAGLKKMHKKLKETQQLWKGRQHRVNAGTGRANVGGAWGSF